MAMSLSSNKWIGYLGSTAALGALLFFTWLMLLITLQYIPAKPDVAFLRIKQDVAHNGFYLAVFFAHVYSSIVVLVAGMLQFSSVIRRRLPAVHRWSGRVYVAVILLVSGPSGLVMGFYGNGGPVAQTAFCLLALLWLYFTFQGFRQIKAGNVAAHRRWMYRSYALTLSAISLRLWKWVIVWIWEPRPMDAYRIVAWLGWVSNLLIVELIIYIYRQKNKPVVSL
jgi:uncharacterized membrane protein